MQIIYKFRAKYVKNNNSILIERKFNPFCEEKGCRPRWYRWDEIDMDGASMDKLEEWKQHIRGKKWYTDEIFDRVNEIYTMYLDRQKYKCK